MADYAYPWRKDSGEPVSRFTQKPSKRGLLGLHGLAEGPTAMGTHVFEVGLRPVESVSCLTLAYQAGYI